MANRRDALKLAAGVALGSQFGNALASGGQETTPAADLSGIFIAGATGEQRVSPVDTEARGAAFFAVNEDGDGIDYTLAVQDLEDVTMAHIHASEVGEAGGVVAWLYPEDAEEPDPIPGGFDGVLATGTITEDDLTGPLEGESLETLLGEMRGGGIYVNVHTEANPDGEVRGQVVTVTEVVDCLGLEQQATTTPEGEETAPPEDGETTPPEDEETPPPEEETTTPDEDGETAEETTTT